MRALLPEPIDDPDLHEVYERDWIGTGGIRVSFVESVDGAMAVDGLSRGLQTPGDNRVFATLRDLADVVLVGAGTAAAENYRPVEPDSRRAQVRARFGLNPALPIVLVSNRIDFDLRTALFRPREGAPRTVVLTHEKAPVDRRAEVEAHADIIVTGDDRVDLAGARAALHDRGWRHILCEGGPSLFGSLLGAGVADELCLTISPILTGGESARIAGPAELARRAAPRLRVSGLLEEDDAFFVRYALR